MVVIPNPKNKIFMIYVVSILWLIKIIVYLLGKDLIVLLNMDKINIFTTYFDFTIVFVSGFAMELLK